MQTIGLSPKAIAAGVTGYIAPLLVGWLATKLDVKIEVSTATALLLPLVTAAATFVAAYLAKVGIVTGDLPPYPDEVLDVNPPVRGP